MLDVRHYASDIKVALLLSVSRRTKAAFCQVAAWCGTRPTFLWVLNLPPYIVDPSQRNNTCIPQHRADLSLLWRSALYIVSIFILCIRYVLVLFVTSSRSFDGSLARGADAFFSFDLPRAHTALLAGRLTGQSAPVYVGVVVVIRSTHHYRSLEGMLLYNKIYLTTLRAEIIICYHVCISPSYPATDSSGNNTRTGYFNARYLLGSESAEPEDLHSE